MGFVRDVATTYATQIWKQAGDMVAGILVARVLGPRGKGSLSVLVALGAHAVLLGGLGVPASCVYFLGRLRDERHRVFANGLWMGVLGGILTAGLLAALGVAFQQQLLGHIDLGLLLLYALTVPFTYFNQLAQAILFGGRRVLAYNTGDFMRGAVMVAGTSVLLLWLHSGLRSLIVLRILLEMTVAAVLIAFLSRSYAIRTAPNIRLLGQQLRYGLRNYASALFWMLLLQSDLILCNFFVGTAQTGVYSVAVSLGGSVTIFPSVVSTLVFQRVSSEASRQRRIDNTNKVMRIVTLVMGLGLLVMCLLARNIIVLLYGSAFVRAALCLVLLAPGLFFLGLELILINFLAGEGSPPIVYQAPLLGLALNIGANLYAIPHWGIYGAAVTSSVAYCAVFLLLLSYYSRVTGSPLGNILALRREDVALPTRASS